VIIQAQHKALNEFLNAKVEETHPNNPNRTEPRVPVVYAHRRERDSFYELPPSVQATLPASVRRELHPRHAVKVRVSHDQKTGQLLAKIIKSRIADLHIYNPLCSLDCRISVNMEMKYDGDIESLIGSADTPRHPDRNKDRLSYTHSHYQIDLTQVTLADVCILASLRSISANP
jgi:polynucleotide 5'-triphosphatase